MGAHWNIGDIIFQLIAIMVVIFVIVIIAGFARSMKKQNERLHSIEEKLGKLLEKRHD
ncbi:DUF4083 domain-containing protein [Metabacillus sp. GX 13764]|uniref:DUF4083 domain-containing protein n=1 Tax=Metabacillus kandeliae TaxID=2900151 RepID=UPI001E566E67|nr:DUF4083 domain-containing protein [Metabacillus kandeliae]MCD7034220.1 DUF4083 domain-containing protein [Metabacillus kandeliae]